MLRPERPPESRVREIRTHGLNGGLAVPRLCSALFTPLRLRETTLRNRVAVSPMCQYSAPDGLPTEWHLVHLGSRAVGGAGLVIAEASAVLPEGRISPDDTGLWSDAHAEAWAPIARFIAEQGAVPAIQLAHAGRKAATEAPWRGGGPVVESGRGWTPVGPSPLAFAEGYPVPRELTVDDIRAVVGAFRDAARRAEQAGFEVVEIHMAHGYLLHQFLSPLTNRRTDEYGGGLDEPDAPAARRGPRGARGLPGGAAGPRPHLRDRLGGGRLGPRAVGRPRPRAPRGRRRPRGLLERRDGARREGPRGARLPGAVRRRHPGAGGRRDRRGRDDHGARPGRGHRGRRAGRPRPARPRDAPRPVLAPAGSTGPRRRDALAGPVPAGATGRPELRVRHGGFLLPLFSASS